LNQRVNPGYGFGEFVLDVEERRLLREGVEIPVSPKVFDTLVVLVENAGHLIDKDEFMRRLWPDTFVGEDALARNISTLRKSLGETGDSQAMIETVPTRGYRFVATVRQVQFTEQPQKREGDSAAAQISPALAGATGKPQPAPKDASAPRGGEVIPNVARPRFPGTAFVIVALALGALAGLATFWLLSPNPAPRVLRMTQITHSGRVDTGLPMASDGSKIYFLERDGDHWNLMQTSVSGGEPQAVSAPFRNTIVLDVSPDHTNLLIGSFLRRNEHMPLWIWPVQGGAPKRVGEVTGYQAIWRTNGRQILYTWDDAIYQADADGANAHKFAATDGTPGFLRWSRDGRRLRFIVFARRVAEAALWEINSDGTNPHRLLPGWDALPQEFEGAWTADGRYFLFDSKHAGTHDIWAIREVKSLFRRPSTQPVRLTAGPITLGWMLPGRDGHTVFVVGVDWKNELVRFDLPSHKFQPFRPDLHARYIAYSPDRAWLAYVHTENGVLARRKLDATQPLDLTPPGLRTWDPHWSPDGRQICFTALTEKGLDKIFLISADGGTPRELFPDKGNQDEASWSPDGKFIAFVSSGDAAAPGPSSHVIQVLNLATNELSVLRESRDRRGPRWSPDGHFIAAITEDGHGLVILDLRTQEWTKVTEGTFLVGNYWSEDSRYVYYQDLLAPNEPLYRIRVSDHRQELVTSFEDYLRGAVQKATVVGTAPDGSPIILLDRNQADIYSLDLDLP